MLFNSIEFLIFFPIVILIYYLIPKKVKYIWLLVASYYFYMSWNAQYAILIAVSTLVTYVAGLLIERNSKKSAKKLVLILDLIVNLGILFVFKYLGFGLNTLNKVLGIIHVSAIEKPFDILLPVGISFYTFQALGYSIDVYRGNVKAEKNPLKYALFVSFFPQLVAGPIERSENLQKQIKEMGERRLWSLEGIVIGFSQMVWGLFMKMVIADRISIFVDSVFVNVYAIGTIETVLGAIAFAIQIYCDFAGYSAVAIGAAKMMGFNLMENFNAPYFAESIPEFWHRWHISLSSWFKDYLYIPLGGNRKGRLRKYLNLMLTFLVSGLWHGAAWTYVLWGGIHGLYQVVGDLLKPIKKSLVKLTKMNTEVFSFRFGKIAITFGLTCFAWIFFRAGSVGEAFEYVKRMLTNWNPWVLFGEDLYTYGLDRREVMILFAAILVLFLTDFICHRRSANFGYCLARQNAWFRWVVLIVLVLVTLVYGEYGINFDSKQFIYFAF